MPSLKHFYIERENVIEVNATMVRTQQLNLPEMSNTKGILVYLYCDTLSRKPSEPIQVNFKRIAFNGEGVAILDYSEDETDVVNSFELGRGGVTKSIEFALPNRLELAALKVYLNERYPMILQNNPWFFENRIHSLKKNYKKEMELRKKNLHTLNN